MERLIAVMREILEELKSVNSKLDNISGDSNLNAITEICDKLESIDDYMSDVKDDVSNIYDRLEDIDISISSLESALKTIEGIN